MQYIAGSDMALVRSGVHRDAICAMADTGPGMFDQIRAVPFTGVANQGDFIEVDAESDAHVLLGIQQGCFNNPHWLPRDIIMGA